LSERSARQSLARKRPDFGPFSKGEKAKEDRRFESLRSTNEALRPARAYHGALLISVDYLVGRDDHMHELLQRLTLGLAFTFTLIGMASTLASGALPPTFVAQQQDRAVRAYCVEWRRTQGKQPLSDDEMNKRVVRRLERRYPTVFPECRADHQGQCLSWINALVEGLRRYGHRSVNAVCSNPQGEGDEIRARLWG